MTLGALLAVFLLSVPTQVPPTVDVVADCGRFTFDVSGVPDGDVVFVSIGGGPPFGFTVGGDAGGFTAQPGGASGSVDLGSYYEGQGYAWEVVESSGQARWGIAGGVVECPPVEPVSVDTVPAVEPAPAPALPIPVAVDLSPWEGVALAPPW